MITLTEKQFNFLKRLGSNKFEFETNNDLQKHIRWLKRKEWEEGLWGWEDLHDYKP